MGVTCVIVCELTALAAFIHVKNAEAQSVERNVVALESMLVFIQRYSRTCTELPFSNLFGIKAPLANLMMKQTTFATSKFCTLSTFFNVTSGNDWYHY